MTVLEKTVVAPYVEVEGLPHPHWENIWDVIPEGASDEQMHLAMHEAVRQWLKALAAALPDTYIVDETANFFLLIPAESKDVNQLPPFCETALEMLTRVLKPLIWHQGHGKHVVLVFANVDSYSSYLAPFYPEDGRHRLAPAVKVGGDYPHVVIGPGITDRAMYSVFHELIHLLLTGYELPLWLEEGLISYLENEFWNRQFQLDDRTLKLHRRHWNSETIQAFWSGWSFDNPGNLSNLSYSLAEIILNLIQSNSKHLFDFVKEAHAVDSGQEAAIEHLGLSLGEIVGMFLGDGNWDPVLSENPEE